FDILLRRIDVREAEAPAVRDMNTMDRRGGSNHFRPETHGFEHALAASRERRGTVVKAGLVRVLAGYCLDHGDAKSERFQRQCKTGTCHAAAGDDDVVSVA